MTTLPKIIDCFIFYNEIELLTYRLNVLNDVVDFFVIVESTHTFTGKAKGLHYQENKHMFTQFHHKIIHVIVEDFPYKFPNVNFHNKNQWTNEYFQRDAISRGLCLISDLKDDDLFIISDLDEIPDPSTLRAIVNGTIKVDINSLCMDLYYYNLNTKIQEPWVAAKIITNKKYKELKLPCNTIRNLDSPVIQYGGWHLSYFGDSRFIQNKIMNFSHQELNLTCFTDLSKIDKRVNDCLDLYDRNIPPKRTKICDNPYLPLQYETYLEKFFT